MKKNEWFDALGLADDKFIDEASGVVGGECADKKIRSRSQKKIRLGIAAIAACLCLIISGLGVWLFTPYERDLSAIDGYSDSEYYELIKVLYELDQKPLKYSNRFQELFGIKSKEYLAYTGENSKDYYYVGNEWNDIGSAMGPSVDGSNESTDGDLVLGDDGTGSGDSYSEITDNQVDGVIEGATTKRSKNYAYHLYCQWLYIYSLEGEESRCLGMWDIESILMEQLPDVSSCRYYTTELYLSEDLTSLTVVTNCTRKGYSNITGMISFDVTDPENISISQVVGISGTYVDSRMVDGELLLFTTSSAYGFEQECQFVPHIIGSDGSYTCISPDDIAWPDRVSSNVYTSIFKMDPASLEIVDCEAVLSTCGQIAVFEDRIVISELDILVKNEGTDDGRVLRRSRYSTRISVITYRDDIEYEGEISVDGLIENRYSMDIKDGILRVFTTTYEFPPSKKLNSLWVGSTPIINASLYCIKLKDMEIVASVEGFAPEGESIRSVAFEGDTAYVCTAVASTDPVFFFDLSNINSITYKQTDPISGFSSSLIDLGGGYLLGVGYDENRCFKLEVYSESGDKIDPIDRYIATDVRNFCLDYKAYFIDRENNMLGITHMIRDDENNQICHYLIYRFNGEKIEIVLDAVIDSEFTVYYSLELARGFIEDGGFYILCNDDIYFFSESK